MWVNMRCKEPANVLLFDKKLLADLKFLDEPFNKLTMSFT